MGTLIQNLAVSDDGMILTAISKITIFSFDRLSG